MRVLYINHYAGSLDMGMEFRPYYFAREWKKRGHDVRIIAADYSHLRKNNPNVKRDFEKQIIDGIEYQWIKTNTYEGNGVNRALTMFQFCGKLLLGAGKLVKEFKPDVVIGSSTYPLDTYPAQIIKKLSKNCVYIHEGHDIWPLTLTEIGGMGKWNPFVVLLGIAEKSAYKKSDKIVSVLPNSIEHMLTHGLNDKRKFTYIPNGICSDDWECAEELSKEYKDLFDKLHNEGKFVVAYLGGHALSNSLDQLLDAANNLKFNNNVSFVLIGKGVEKERLQNRARDMGLDNVCFLPPVSKKQVPSALKEADALYIGAESSPLYKYGVSMNKVYDYMMSGRPILYGVVAYNNEVNDANCGISFDSSKVEEICEAIKMISSLDFVRREQMGNKGKEWVLKNFEYSALADKFEKLF